MIVDFKFRKISKPAPNGYRFIDINRIRIIFVLKAAKKLAEFLQRVSEWPWL